MVDTNECHKVVTGLVRKAGQIIKSRIWNAKSDVQIKSCSIDLVTETDKEVEQLLISNLSSKFPDHKFIGEESVADGAKCILTDDPTWIIDPVDGTLNFVHGYPNVCVSIALLVNKIPEIGIIYNPVIDHFFEAVRGQGALLNGNKINVSKQEELSKSLLGIEFGTSRDMDKAKNVFENLQNLLPVVHGARSSGSAAYNMALVALGATEVYYEFGTHAWDVAAGDIIVREAGGVVIDPAGGPFDIMSRRVLCAGTREVAEEIVKVLIQFYPERD